MSAAAVHPSSSPRLPSPPPLTEVQIGPQSPSVGDSFGKDTEQFSGYTQDDNDDVNSTRRVRPGSKALDMAGGPPLVPLAQVGLPWLIKIDLARARADIVFVHVDQLDSPFQLQEHLKALHNHFTRPENSDTVAPIHRDVAIQLAEPPEGVDRALWLYELCRFLTMKINNLIVAFFFENPPCSAQTCPEMQASEWQYLCAVHDPPKTCCAIDYCCHTLDWATNILTSPKYFPSRLTLGLEASGGPQASMRHLVNIFRRLYRIFAHAWFKHREVFWQVESNEGLYVFFKTVCDVYHLIPEDNYTVPPEAEGIDPQPPAEVPAEVPRLTLLRKEDETPSDAGATTRRHKHTPSTGSRVTTIAESAEDSEPLPEVEEDDAAAAEEETESTTAPEPEETATPGESQNQESENKEAQEPTEQPSNGDIADVQQEDTKEPELEEPAKEKPEEVTQPQSTEEVETKLEESKPEETEPESKPEETKPEEPKLEETKTETKESKPEGEGKIASPEEVTTKSSEPAPEPASEPATEPKSKPKSNSEVDAEARAEEKRPEQDSEPKSETETAKDA